MKNIIIEKLNEDHPARTWGYQWSASIYIDGAYAGNGKFFQTRSEAESYKQNEKQMMQ